MLFNMPDDKTLYPSYDPETQDERASTTFSRDFRIAALFGMDDVIDTFDRSMDDYKSDIKMLTELAVVTNHLGWMFHGRGDVNAAKAFFGFYERVKSRVYAADAPFTQDDRGFYFRVTD